jgi:hypothetical protein
MAALGNAASSRSRISWSTISPPRLIVSRLELSQAPAGYVQIFDLVRPVFTVTSVLLHRRNAISIVRDHVVVDLNVGGRCNQNSRPP